MSSLASTARFALTLAAAALIPKPAAAALPALEKAPVLRLVHQFKLPRTITGHFDHFAVDPTRHRLFATAVDHHSIVVFDFKSGRVLAEVGGVKEPRGVIYRADVHRLFVSDGAGFVRVFDSDGYAPIKVLKLLVDADPVAYDPETKRMFVVNGGEKAKHSYSNITVIDTDALAEVGNIQIPGIEIEGLTVEHNGPRLFANNRDRNEIDVLDRVTLKSLEIWPVRAIRRNTVSVLDERSHRLFVAGHEGQLLVMDSHNGRELNALPIGLGADDIAFDPRTRLIYVAGGGGQGSIDVYHEDDPDKYSLLLHLATEPGAATAQLVPELHEYVVLVPPRQGNRAQVLVFATADPEQSPVRH